MSLARTAAFATLYALAAVIGRMIVLSIWAGLRIPPRFVVLHNLVDAQGRVALRNEATSRILAGRISPEDRVTDIGHYGMLGLDGAPLSDDETAYARAPTPPRAMPAPASAWRSAGASCSGTAAPSGPRTTRPAAPGSSSSCPAGSFDGWILTLVETWCWSWAAPV